MGTFRVLTEAFLNGNLDEIQKLNLNTGNKKNLLLVANNFFWAKGHFFWVGRVMPNRFF